MRHLLPLLVVIAACASPEPAPLPTRFREGHVGMTVDAQELAPSAVVDSALFVQVELRPLLTSDEALASIGVAFPERPLGVVELDSTQVMTIMEELSERYVRHPIHPVVTLHDRQPVSVVREGEAPLALQPTVLPTVLESRRRVRLELRGRGALLDVTVPDGAALLLREGGGGVSPRWTLVCLKAISLRDEDARRYTLDED